MKKKKVRLPRKTKKSLIDECGRSEFETQSNLIKNGILNHYIIL